MYDVSRLLRPRFSDAIGKERDGHMKLHNRLYYIFSDIDVASIGELTGGNLCWEIRDECLRIIEEYDPDPRYLSMVMKKVDAEFHLMQRKFQEMDQQDLYAVEYAQELLADSQRVIGMIVDFIYPAIPTRIDRAALSFESQL